MPDSTTVTIGEEISVDWSDPAEGTEVTTGTMRVIAIQETPIKVITLGQ